MMLSHLVSSNYARYLSFLRELVRIPSVYTDTRRMLQAVSYCRAICEHALPAYEVREDEAHNLIATPIDLDLEKPILYLNAHTDVVDADESEWDAPFSPWEIWEDEREMVGRGVCDCKAGVALELFVVDLVANRQVELNNTVFTISAKEEGPGFKSATALGAAFGDSLPLSHAQTYMLVLENNVSVGPKLILSIYARERGSFVIKVEGTISYLQSILEKLTDWNPVGMIPHDSWQDDDRCEVYEQVGGHVCSVERDVNLLTKVVREADQCMCIQAGEENSFSVVPSRIRVCQVDEAVEHTLILANRTFADEAAIRRQIEGIEYLEAKDFGISAGFDRSEQFARDPISEAIRSAKTDHLDIELTHNVGQSDASTILASMPDRLRECILPLVMGPGTRSQRERQPPRLTHGKNETYDKIAGQKAISYILCVLEQMNFLHVSQ